MQTGKGLLLKADPIAAAFRDEVKSSLTRCLRRPRLVGILATSSAPSKFYAEFTKKQCEDLGVEFILKNTGAADTGDLGEGEGVEEAIIEANEDDNVDGIMVCIKTQWNRVAAMNTRRCTTQYSVHNRSVCSAVPFTARITRIPQDHYLQQVRVFLASSARKKRVH
jgi:hypothetical protein